MEKILLIDDDEGLNHFLNRFKEEKGMMGLSISEKAMERMLNYDWPGNVRELENAIERAVVMGDGHQILPDDLPIGGPKANPSNIEVGMTLKEALDRFKKDFVTLNLKHSRGNRSQAAKLMGIQRTYLSRLISKYAL